MFSFTKYSAKPQILVRKKKQNKKQINQGNSGQRTQPCNSQKENANDNGG